MNELYHVVCKFKNWEKYFHLATLDAVWSVQYITDASNSQYKAYVLEGRVKFYFDGKWRVKKFTKRKVTSSWYRYATHEDDFIERKCKEIASELELQKEEILASNEYVEKTSGHKQDKIRILVHKAEECLLDMNNPLPTSTFLVEFLNEFKWIKEE